MCARRPHLISDPTKALQPPASAHASRIAKSAARQRFLRILLKGARLEESDALVVQSQVCRLRRVIRVEHETLAGRSAEDADVADRTREACLCRRSTTAVHLEAADLYCRSRGRTLPSLTIQALSVPKFITATHRVTRPIPKPQDRGRECALAALRIGSRIEIGREVILGLGRRFLQAIRRSRNGMACLHRRFSASLS